MAKYCWYWMISIYLRFIIKNVQKNTFNKNKTNIGFLICMRTSAPAMERSKSLSSLWGRADSSSPQNRRAKCDARGEIVSKRLISYFGVVAVCKFDRNRRRTINNIEAIRDGEPGPRRQGHFLLPRIGTGPTRRSPGGLSDKLLAWRTRVTAASGWRAGQVPGPGPACVSHWKRRKCGDAYFWCHLYTRYV